MVPEFYSPHGMNSGRAFAGYLNEDSLNPEDSVNSDRAQSKPRYCAK